MIVLDIDGVVADFYSELVFVMNEAGMNIQDWSEWKDYHFSNIVPDCDPLLIEAMINNPMVTKNCKPFEESWYWTNYQGARYDIMYLTSRDISLSSQTWNWFYDWDMPADFIVFEKNKVEFLTGLQVDVYVDDHPEAVQLARSSGINAYLMNMPYNLNFDIDSVFRIDSLWDIDMP